MVDNYKPSIDTAGEFCVCYQPGDAVGKEFHLRMPDWQEEIIEQRRDEEGAKKKNKEKNSSNMNF